MQRAARELVDPQQVKTGDLHSTLLPMGVQTLSGPEPMVTVGDIAIPLRMGMTDSPAHPAAAHRLGYHLHHQVQVHLTDIRIKDQTHQVITLVHSYFGWVGDHFLKLTSYLIVASCRDRDRCFCRYKYIYIVFNSFMFNKFQFFPSCEVHK